MIKLLNIVPDEKFIDDVIEYHSYTDDIANHIYLHISLRHKKTFRYIKRKEAILQIKPFHFLKYLSDNFFDGIIIHNLAALPPHLISVIPKRIPVMWSSWGMDIYSSPPGRPLVPIENLIHPLTKSALYNVRRPSFSAKLMTALRTILSGESISKSKRENSYLAAVNRSDLFSSVIPLEYDLIKNKPFFRAKYVEYHYYNPSLFSSPVKLKPKEDKLLIGNSAAPTNNHFEIFRILSQMDTSKYRLITPLNYGADKKWIDILVAQGQKMLGQNFEPITSFLSFNKYSELISGCSHAIFYHERQQGLGNIYFLLENGCKLFLSENSATYKYFKSIGLHVYSIQSELTQKNLDKPLDSGKAISNNRIISELVRDKNRAINVLHNLYREFENIKKATQH